MCDAMTVAGYKSTKRVPLRLSVRDEGERDTGVLSKRFKFQQLSTKRQSQLLNAVVRGPCGKHLLPALFGNEYEGRVRGYDHVVRDIVVTILCPAFPLLCSATRAIFFS